MTMSNIAALAVHNTSFEFEIHSPSVELMAMHRVFDEL